MSNTARTIWPNLKSGDSPKQQQQRAQSLSAAMYPALTPQAKRWDDWRERDRQALLEAPREVNQRSRLQRERRR